MRQSPVYGTSLEIKVSRAIWLKHMKLTSVCRHGIHQYDEEVVQYVG
jgi:hypothetical protein